MKRMMFILLLCVAVLCGCDNGDEIPEGPAELWVVTELTDDFGMNDQAERMIDDFVEMYPNVTVKLDILPTKKEERAVYLEKLRTAIMAGNGPDVYLLPTDNYVPDVNSIYGEEKQVVPLFRDVNQTMYNGLFYDIGEFYDEDETLEKEELNNSVMDGVLMDGARYVLPLRYDTGVYLVDRSNLEALGVDISVFEGTVKDMMELAIELGDKDFMMDVGASDRAYYFSATNDYQTGKVALTVEEVAEYMRLEQALSAAQGTGLDEGYASLRMYVTENSYFSKDGDAIYNGRLSGLLGAVATAKVLNEDVEVYPQRAVDGSLNAVVRYYAAVGASTAYPRLAYEFARLFLCDEAQYETYLSTRYYARSEGTACDGWPVRSVGSVNPRFANIKFSMQHNPLYDNPDSGAKNRTKKFMVSKFSMTDEDIPAIFWEMDNVLFPVIMEFEDSLPNYLRELNDPDLDYAPTDVDIDALAQAYIDKMQLYLDEG